MRYPNIEKARTRLGMSRKRLGSLLGVSGKTLAGWARNGDIPQWALVRLGQLLDCSVDFLLGRCDHSTTGDVQ